MLTICGIYLYVEFHSYHILHLARSMILFSSKESAVLLGQPYRTPEDTAGLLVR